MELDLELPRTRIRGVIPDQRVIHKRAVGGAPSIDVISTYGYPDNKIPIEQVVSDDDVAGDLSQVL